MRAFVKTTLTELKLILREPAAVFFTLILPVLLLVMNGFGGNEPDPRFGGAGVLDILLPGYVALVIATTGMQVLPSVLAQYREQGILRRLRVTPLRPATVLAAHVAVNLVMTAIGLVLLVALGLAFYDLNPPQAPVAFAVAVLLSALSMFALSFVLASVLPTARTTSAVASVIYFPMIFFSGAIFPREVMPGVLQRISTVLPLTYAVEAMSDPWSGGGWAWVPLAVLVALLAAAVAISSRTFRWQ